MFKKCVTYVLSRYFTEFLPILIIFCVDRHTEAQILKAIIQLQGLNSGIILSKAIKFSLFHIVDNFDLCCFFQGTQAEVRGNRSLLNIPQAAGWMSEARDTESSVSKCSESGLRMQGPEDQRLPG